jgi:hypothetical protein
MTGTDELRILVSCWANAPAVAAVGELIGEIGRLRPVEAMAVTTNDPRSLEVFADHGLRAISMRQVVADAADVPTPALSGETLDALTEGDRLRAYRPLPEADAPAGAAYYRWAAGRLAAGYGHLIGAMRPHVLLTWNGTGGALNAAAAHAAAARGLPTFFLERGLLPGTLVVDPTGVNYASHVAGPRWRRMTRPPVGADDLAAVRQYCRDLRASEKTIVQRGRAFSPRQLREHLSIPASAPVVLLALQIENDTNITRYSPHYKRMAEVLRDVQAALAAAAPQAHLIVKPHPEDRDRLAELTAFCGPRTRLCADAAVGSLLAAAEAVVVVNSTVGLEALVHHKPVVLLGRAVYGEKGFTFDVPDPSALAGNLAAALAAARSGAFDERAFGEFLAYLLKHCLFALGDADPWGSRRRIAAAVAAAAGI